MSFWVNASMLLSGVRVGVDKSLSVFSFWEFGVLLSLSLSLLLVSLSPWVVLSWMVLSLLVSSLLEDLVASGEESFMSASPSSPSSCPSFLTTESGFLSGEEDAEAESLCASSPSPLSLSLPLSWSSPSPFLSASVFPSSPSCSLRIISLISEKKMLYAERGRRGALNSLTGLTITSGGGASTAAPSAATCDLSSDLEGASRPRRDCG
mmetsp:Transcript_11785/g.21925  ORF Transcript_11785/g.21925 Transcript_11785/m.21925 type:complete len:208 (-) Transcript_11785:1080-1703(-)